MEIVIMQFYDRGYETKTLETIYHQAYNSDKILQKNTTIYI